MVLLMLGAYLTSFQPALLPTFYSTNWPAAQSYKTYPFLAARDGDSQ